MNDLINMEEWDDFGALSAAISEEQQETVIDEAADKLSNLSLAELANVERMAPRVTSAVRDALHRRRLNASPDMIAEMAEKVHGRVGGFGFLLPLFKRDDISEITVNPDATLWVMRKGARDFEKVGSSLNQLEVSRVTDTLLRYVGRAINEATPSVDAKLPRIKEFAALRGGARIKVLHSAVVPGDNGIPSINIRFFEPKPVPPEQLVKWNSAPEPVIRKLLELVGKGYRVMVSGGTASGKTTLLSALCNGIPKEARVVKIEDPEEIYISHPNCVPIEARPGSGSQPPYTVTDGVNDAMRMSPRWLIVGEVRTGNAALALFRAAMSDHPSLTTFHADSPDAAVQRLCVVLYSDENVRMDAAKGFFVEATELFIQIGWHERQRRILGIYEIDKERKGGDVHFKQLYEVGDEIMKDPQRVVV